MDGPVRARARFWMRVLIVATGVVCSCPSPATAQSSQRAERQLVVRVAPGADGDAVGRELEAIGSRPLPLRGLRVLRFGSPVTPRRLARARAHRGVVWAEPDQVLSAASTADPLFDDQWALADVRAPEAWAVTSGSSSAPVAIVDSGMAMAHADLRDRTWRNPGESGAGRDANGIDDDDNGLVDDVQGWDFVDGDAVPNDLIGHGTLIAGVVGAAAGNGIAGAGVAPQAPLMTLRVLDRRGQAVTSDVAFAVAYAAKHGARVVNLSLGGPYSHTLDELVDTYGDVLFVAAAGNDGGDVDADAATWPCALPHENLVCVAATGLGGAVPDWTNTGATSVDLAAPGVDVLGPAPEQVVVYHEGFETPDWSERWYSWHGPPWERAQEHAASGAWALVDSPGGDYAPDTVTTLQSYGMMVDGWGLPGCRIAYDAHLELDGGDDGFEVVLSADGGSGETLQRFVGPFTGNVRLEYPVWPLAFPNYRHWAFRFVFFSGSVGTGDGVAIDDLTARCTDPGAPTTATDRLQGTSFAAPHVSAAAALAFSLDPLATPGEIRAALIETAQPVAALEHRTVSGGRLDVRGTLDAMGAPAPAPTPTPTPTATATPGPVEPDAGGDAPRDAVTRSVRVVRPPLKLSTRMEWVREGRRVRLGRLRMSARPGTRLVLSCTGPGCRFLRRARTLRFGRTDWVVQKPARKALGRATLEILALRATRGGAVVYEIRGGKVVRRTACVAAATETVMPCPG